MRIGIATDHGGYGLKQELVVQLRAAGHEVIDFGAHSLGVDDVRIPTDRRKPRILRPRFRGRPAGSRLLNQSAS